MKLKEFISQVSVPNETAINDVKESDTKSKEDASTKGKEDVIIKGKTLAIMDTAGGKIKIDTSVRNIKPEKGKILIMKDYVGLNSALTRLGNIYKLKKLQ